MKSSNKTKQFNLQTYKFEIAFLPYDGDPLYLNPDAVLQLVLEDDLMTWYRRGMVMFQNGYESFERTLDLKKSKGIIEQTKLSDMNKSGYIFRNDGKDRISIKIKPILNEGHVTGLIEPEDDNWLIDFVGNIYDFEEPMVSDLGSKVKKVYFWDEKFQKMIEKDLFWSSSTSILNEKTQTAEYDPKNATDYERKMLTGIAIKDILTNYMLFDVDENNFDKGSTEIFHTAPNQSNVWENLNYLLENHFSDITLKSGNNDICIFIFDRTTKKFKLMPLSKIFEKAGKQVDKPKEYQIEHLVLEDIGESEESKDAGKLWMAPVLKQYDPNIDVKITRLKKYAFSDMAGVDSMREMVTTAIHTYDHKNKTFTKSVNNSLITNLSKNLKTDYIEPFLFSKTPQTLINLNKVKTNNLKVNSKHTPIANRKILDKLGHGNLILKSIMLNLCLTVELEGATHRKPARFIGVDRVTNNNSEFDYKLGGQWFIVSVKHNFFKNTYANEVVLVKPQVFDKINVNETIE